MGGALQPAQPQQLGGHEPTNLGDILERVLDKGLVIVGDIRVSLLDIELLTIKLRLLVASVETAQEIGIDWWKNDPWLSASGSDLQQENRRLKERLAELEGDGEPQSVEAHPREADQVRSVDRERTGRSRDEPED